MGLPLHRAILVVVGGAVLLGGGLFAGWWFTIGVPMREHERRIENAHSLLRNYTHADWAAFYQACLPLFEKDVADKKIWPKQLRALDPYTIFADGDLLLMQWTGGFDDEPFYLYVFRKDMQFNEDPPPDKAGIRILGPKDLPEHPFRR